MTWNAINIWLCVQYRRWQQQWMHFFSCSHFCPWVYWSLSQWGHTYVPGTCTYIKIHHCICSKCVYLSSSSIFLARTHISCLLPPRAPSWNLPFSEWVSERVSEWLPYLGPHASVSLKTLYYWDEIFCLFPSPPCTASSCRPTLEVLHL